MLTYILFKIVDLLLLTIFLKAILSWIPYDRSLKGMYDFFEKVTDPIMSLAYRLTGNRLISNGVDFTPLVACAILYVFKRIVIVLL